MYGLEKEPVEPFVFDLEKDVKNKTARGKQVQENVEQKIQEIKKLLREGAGEKDFDQLGILLHGYASLQKVLRKVAK